MSQMMDDVLYSKIEMALFRSHLEAIVSVTIASADILSADMALLKFLVKDKKMKGSIICVDRDYKQMEELAKSIDLGGDDLYYIDAVTLYNGKNPDASASDKTVFIDSPSDLTSMDIAITDMIEKLENGFLLFDCLSSLKLYNDSKKLGIFMHDLASKLRLYGVFGVILLIEEDSDTWLHSIIKAFCDKNVVLKTGRDIT
ncbi:MAG: hypothetical protein SVM80_00490 [Halobacteriota archaeon]|nr:hypothetical protein [Halobacteriota archaeon]